jgi:hypothetical protein
MNFIENMPKLQNMTRVITDKTLETSCASNVPIVTNTSNPKELVAHILILDTQVIIIGSTEISISGRHILLLLLFLIYVRKIVDIVIMSGIDCVNAYIKIIQQHCLTIIAHHH